MPPKRKYCIRGHLRISVDPSGMCYPCKGLYQKRYRKTAQGQVIYKSFMLKKYGITYLEYQTMLKKQKNQCAICLEVKPLAVDHNHQTGKVRGLLCTHCNVVIVWLLENKSELIIRAKQYLEETNENSTKI